jgi:hypothetical protein
MVAPPLQVSVLGGPEEVRRIPLGPIPHPHQREPSGPKASSSQGATADADAAAGGAALPAFAAIQQWGASATAAAPPPARQLQQQDALPAAAAVPRVAQKAQLGRGGEDATGQVHDGGLGRDLGEGGSSPTQPQLNAWQQLAGEQGGAQEQAPAEEEGGSGGTSRGDGVQRFSEVDAAAGALGRFPGSQVMLLIRQFVGLEQAS